jgi:hypothetical protein
MARFLAGDERIKKNRSNSFIVYSSCRHAEPGKTYGACPPQTSSAWRHDPRATHPQKLKKTWPHCRGASSRFSGRENFVCLNAHRRSSSCCRQGLAIQILDKNARKLHAT